MYEARPRRDGVMRVFSRSQFAVFFRSKTFETKVSRKRKISAVVDNCHISRTARASRDSNFHAEIFRDIILLRANRIILMIFKT